MIFVSAEKLKRLRNVYDAVRARDFPTRTEVAGWATGGNAAEAARLLNDLKAAGLIQSRLLSETEESVWLIDQQRKFADTFAVHPEGEARISCEFYPSQLRPGDIAMIDDICCLVVGITVVAKPSVEVLYRRVFKTGRVASGPPEFTFCNMYRTYVVSGLIPSAEVSNVGNVKEVSKSTKGSNMAKVKVKKTAAKAAPVKAKSAGAAKTRRTQADVDALAPIFQEHLAGGGKMKVLKEQHNFSDDGPIRAALYRAGFDSKGDEHGVKEGDLSSLTPAKLKAEVVKLRQAGDPWYAIAYRTGETEGALKKMVADAGGPVGRVYREPKAKPAAAKVGSKKSSAKSRKATAADPS